MNHPSRSDYNFFANDPDRIQIFQLTNVREAFYSDQPFILSICVRVSMATLTDQETRKQSPEEQLSDYF